MSKPRSWVADFAVYVVVRIVVCFIQALSLQQARAVAGFLAWVIQRVDRRHREVARDNLRQAFPGKYSDAELNELVDAVYLHFCNLLVEILHLPRKLHTNNWRRHLDLPQGRAIVRCLLSGRPVMIVTMHFGNWEMAGYSLGLFGFTTHAIARPIDNPYLDDFLRRFREATGQKVLAKKDDFDQIQAVLAANGVLATLADQDAGQRGLFVDFFGRPASTHKAIALLALEFGVPLLVVGVRKKADPIQYEVWLQDLVWPEDFEGRADALKAITQRYTAGLEGIIRTAPEQYFWVHRRWKSQPPKPRRKAG